MADNYLERRRELYEIRKAEWLKKKRHMPVKPRKTNESSTLSQEREI
ncbi:MAG: dehydrogenase [Prevotella sp.]|nr:dehydrogenase [Prevotella sp.]